MAKKEWKNITKERIIQAVEQSTTIKEACIFLGVNHRNSRHYYYLNEMIRKYQIDKSHFVGSGWSKGKHRPDYMIPLDIYMANPKIKSNRLRDKLIAMGVMEKCCNRCYETKWLNQDIPLELHHKDSNRSNNKLDNLEILCPNCHTLTANHAVIKKYRK